jgi:hypothetical protein
MSEPLRALQGQFLAAVTGGGRDAEALIVDDDRVGAARRLDIYRNNYRASLTGVLSDHFARLYAYLGDAQFGNVAAAYIDRHPSTTRNLRYYGGAFAAFLADNYPEDSELAELAALDWALRAAFDAPDAAVLGAPCVVALGNSWIDRRLVLHPSGQLVTMRHNSAAIWRALDRDEAPPPVALLADPVRVLVWRGAEQPMFRSLLADEAAALARLATGISITGLSAHVVDTWGEAVATVTLAGWLTAWLGDGVLTLAAD